MATETYLMFSTTNINDVQIKYEYQVMLLTFIYFRQLLVSFISVDINECVARSDSCSPDAYCNNTKGSCNCTCKPASLGVKENVGVSVTFENIE